MPYSVLDRRGNKLYYNDQHQCHREDGYAIEFNKKWADQYFRNLFDKSTVPQGCYYLKGVYIPYDLYEKFLNKTLTAKDILDEENIEIRRILIEYYGLEKFIIDSKAEIVAKNKYGTIYCKRFIGWWDANEDEPIVVVKVKNSTPEIDGSHKDYFIRVPPQFGKTKRKWFFFRNNSLVQEAIAWTFDLTAEEYNPTIET